MLGSNTHVMKRRKTIPNITALSENFCLLNIFPEHRILGKF